MSPTSRSRSHSREQSRSSLRKRCRSQSRGSDDIPDASAEHQGRPALSWLWPFARSISASFPLTQEWLNWHADELGHKLKHLEFVLSKAQNVPAHGQLRIEHDQVALDKLLNANPTPSESMKRHLIRELDSLIALICPFTSVEVQEYIAYYQPVTSPLSLYDYVSDTLGVWSPYRH